MSHTNGGYNFILTDKTIGELFAQRVSETPDAIAIEFENQTTTWKELDRLSDWLVKRFDFLGIKAGTRCALWCGNQLQWVIVYLGLQKIGATAILVNPGYLADELYRMLEYAEIEYLFYGETFKDQSLTDIIDHLDLSKHPKLKQTIPIELEDAVDFMKEGATQLTDADFDRIKELKRIPKADDVACMLFTSGTSSTPKGVLLSHNNVVNTARATAQQMHWEKEDRICVMVPLFHCFGMTSCLLGAIVSGASLYIMKHYRTKDALDAIQNHGCTVLNGVPSMFLAMIYNHEFDKYDLSNLKNGIIAGSAITESDYTRICEKLHCNHIQMSYGQTETSPGVSFSDYDETIEAKSNNAGFIIPGLDYGICDLNTKQIHIKPNDEQITGEIMIKGFAVMQGYYKRKEETEKALQADGWLHTGDQGYFDKDGHLHILARLSEMIIRGGENISPVEIEKCILELPEIKQVKIVGVPHPVLQEELAAAVVLKKKKAISDERIKQHVGEHLAKYKVPAYIEFFDEIPMTTSGKVATGEIKNEMKRRNIGEYKEEKK